MENLRTEEECHVIDMQAALEKTGEAWFSGCTKLAQDIGDTCRKGFMLHHVGVRWCKYVTFFKHVKLHHVKHVTSC